MADNRRPVAEPEVHLLPDGYIGRVTIHHGRADGVPAAREGDARLYVIPPDGVLATQAAPNVGIRPPERMRCYWVKPTGERAALPSKPPPGSDAVGVFAIYVVGADFHYVVDRIANAGRYPNPAYAATR